MIRRSAPGPSSTLSAAVENSMPSKLLILRAEARTRGKKLFRVGEPCVHGHKADRYVSSGACVVCSLDARSTPEGKALAVKRVMKHFEKFPHHRRDVERKRCARLGGYEAPPLEKDCPSKPEDGRCDCCLRPIAERGPWGFVLDHDHTTGGFRGWVCNGCNTGNNIIDQADWLRTRADFLDGLLPWQ